jgi:Putative transposase/Transposase zinc-binding domain
MQAHTLIGEATPALRTRLEVADIFRTHGEHYRSTHPLNKEQIKAMTDIQRCRTAALGGHVDVCDNGCGFLRISYNSCRNRNCPKCQTLQSARWLEKRCERILPTQYFHLVVTFPHQLNPLILHNKEVLYNILFRSAAQSLLELARGWKRLQAQIGFTAILHTWSQDLRFHPHLHMVVTAGGLDKSQTRWIESRNKFLVPVKALCVKIRGKFVHQLKLAYDQSKIVFRGSTQDLADPEAFASFVNGLYRKNWVIYSKQSFAGPEHVFGYLSRYTHKVAISNHRLVRMIDGSVTFLARDNHNTGKKRSVTVTAEELIRRFLLHVLPARFIKIRHYGLMASSNARTKLEIARKLLEQARPQALESNPASGPLQPARTWQEIFFHVTGVDLTVCPQCGKGHLIRQPLSILLETSTFPAPPRFLDSS